MALDQTSATLRESARRSGSGQRLVRAVFDESVIRVYQAYAPEIGLPAVKAGRFVPPFRRSRMTWIKPSLCWMMYRSGWAQKPGQQMVLAIDLLRRGFDWALANSCLTSFDRTLHASIDAWRSALSRSVVRVQWDPERAVDLEALSNRTIQVGLSGSAVDAYVDDWIVKIEDVTTLVRKLHASVTLRDFSRAMGLLPQERDYPVVPEVASRLGADLILTSPST